MPVKFKVDGFDVEVADSNTQSVIERAIKAQAERADAAEKALSDANKAHASKVEVLDSKIKEQADQIAQHPAQLAKELATLGSLGAELTKLGVDTTKLDASEAAYLKAGIGKRNAKLVTDGKDLSSLKVMWETLQSMPEPSTVEKARAGIGAEVTDVADNSAEAARQRMLKRNAEMFTKQGA